MIIIRRYKKLDWWSFLDQIELDLNNGPSKEIYIEIADELRMRKLESVSEGGDFKLKSPAKNLRGKFDERVASCNDFASVQDITEFNEIINFILD